MAIKDLLIAFDGNDNAMKAVQFGARVAEKYGASVTGIHVYKPKEYESQYRRWIPESVLENIQSAELEAEKSIGETFQSAVKEAGYDGEAKWIACEGRPDVPQRLPRSSRRPLPRR